MANWTFIKEEKKWKKENYYIHKVERNFTLYAIGRGYIKDFKTLINAKKVGNLFING